jgi:hypothetical protein
MKRGTAIGIGAGIAIILGLAGGAVAYDNRKRKFEVYAPGCAVLSYRSYYIVAWKNPATDPQGTEQYQAGICNGPSCGEKQCWGTLMLSRGDYRIALVDNNGGIYYCEDLTISNDTRVTVDVSKIKGTTDPTRPLPVPLPPS